MAAIEPVVGIANKYRGEFEETFEGLRQRAVSLQQNGPQMIADAQSAIEPKKQEFLTIVQDMSDVATPAPVVLTTLSWTAVMLLASTLASYVSSYVLAPIVGSAVGTLGALGIVFGLAPLYAHSKNFGDILDKATDVHMRYRLLNVSLFTGTIIGYLVGNSYLSAAPLDFLFVGVAAAAYPFAEEKLGKSRQMVLGGSVGAALGVSTVLALLSGNLTMTYIITSLLYTAVTVVVLQYLFKNVPNEQEPTYTYQMALYFLITYAYLTSHLVFGMDGEAYSTYKSGAAAQTQQ